MAIGEGGATHRRLRTLLHLGAAGGLSDGQLLERFAAGRDEAADATARLIATRAIVPGAVATLAQGVCRSMTLAPGWKAAPALPSPGNTRPDEDPTGPARLPDLPR